MFVSILLIRADEDIRITNASIGWSSSTPTLSNINLTIETGKLIAVVGKVGSGKSSLLSAILGEMIKLEGTIDVREVCLDQNGYNRGESLIQATSYAEQSYSKSLLSN